MLKRVSWALARWVAGRAHAVAGWSGAVRIGALLCAVAAALFVGGAAATAEIAESLAEDDGLTAVDRPVLDWMVAHRTPGLNDWVTGFTHVGGTIGGTVLAVLAAIGLSLWWRRATPAVFMVTGMLASLAATVVGKRVIGRARPDLSQAVPPYEHSASFPSGHTLNATVFAGLVLYLVLAHASTRWVRWVVGVLCALYAVGIGLSRVYLGHHWVTDVAVGWAAGLCWVALLVTFHRFWLTLQLWRGDRAAAAEELAAAEQAMASEQGLSAGAAARRP